MGTIKDLVDLVTQLSNRIQDRKSASELREIQSLIASIQVSQSALDQQNMALRADNSELKQQILSLNRSISDLQQQISTTNNKTPQPNSSLSKEAENILLLLAKTEEITVNQISHGISLNIVKTEYWVEILYKKEMVSCSMAIGQDTQYYLDQKGREHLILNNLI